MGRNRTGLWIQLRGSLTGVLILALTLTAGTVRADQCARVKLDAVGKKACGLLNCESKVAATNDRSHLAECRAKVEAKFSRAFARAACAGDETQCEDAADDCDSAMAALLTDVFPNACEAAKRRAAGRLAKRELRCYATAAGRGLVVDTACITKAQGRFAAALADAGTCPDGGSPQDAVEQYCVRRAARTDSEGHVVEVCALPPMCGNGIIKGDEQCDGQAMCGADCLVHIPLCRDLGICGIDTTATVGPTGWALLTHFTDECGSYGAGVSIGGTCVPAVCPPDVPPGVTCGTCQGTPFPTTTVCCQQGSACFEQPVSTWSELINVRCDPPPAGSDRFVVGTCGANGDCVPAS